MRTLVTGASGYIGLHLVKALLHGGQQVTAITRAKERMGALQEEAGLRIIEADLEDQGWYEDVLAGHQCCIHAALIWGNPDSEMEGRDATITARFFESVGMAKVRRAIYLSSLAVHRPSQGLVTERNAFTTTSLYGATKAAGELFFRAACARHEISGVVVRPGPVLGRPAYSGGSLRTPQQLEQFVDLARRGLPLTVNAGSSVQFCDVHALTRLLVKLTREAAPEATYLCVDEKSFQWEDIARHVVDVLSSQSQVTVKEANEDQAPMHFRSNHAASLPDVMADSTTSLSEHIRSLVEAPQACP